MPVIERIAGYAADLTAIRQDFHAHPEIGFQETRTSSRVAELLEGWGIAVTRGVGGTGVVGVLQGRRAGRTIGLRADMDALPMEEMTNLPYSSRHPGVFHGCGHDGHTTMLLGAARYLAETRDFAGQAVFIFQPAEEGLGGARAMLRDGLFDRFPCDELYGLHNSPYNRHSEVTIRPGRAQAGASFFDITIHGRGSHGAMPQASRDPVVIGAELVSALQTIVARNIDPTHAAVVSVTRFQAGSAYNVIPAEAQLAGTFRYFEEQDARLIAERITEICAGLATAHGVQIDTDIRQVFDVLINDPERVENLISSASDIVGGQARADAELTMGSEDMADLLRIVPGAFFNLGHDGEVPLHNPGFLFDDTILPVGASLLAHLVESRGEA
ncbi:amidohydrolase [Haematobacter missouriensis]|uniref:Amidohydrolase n=1 Tax=Haematobacter missouriensis TaxID=366616 RepID=A0A212ANE4_9RHOB|nr:amidohydrolase [Haematobacter missouriensis]KFI25090.1 amidohydrolase [Haematobacter missouriensis]OWJ73848.1 amidohydrolase [Haematobacter missouriensis]OWJ83017.1 amidohydrolase [Haematobacter missouriensis]